MGYNTSLSSFYFPALILRHSHSQGPFSDGLAGTSSVFTIIQGCSESAYLLLLLSFFSQWRRGCYKISVSQTQVLSFKLFLPRQQVHSLTVPDNFLLFCSFTQEHTILHAPTHSSSHTHTHIFTHTCAHPLSYTH